VIGETAGHIAAHPDLFRAMTEAAHLLTPFYPRCVYEALINNTTV
jgi:hypothetical protein